MIPFVDLRAQHQAHRREIDAALLDAAAAGEFVLGRALTEFEDEFARYCEAAHCVGVGSGTAALALGFSALGLRPGDEVIAPANTFVASVVPAVQLGARVVLVDCDEQGLIDVHALEAAITERTRAVVAVHLYGHPAGLHRLTRICEARGLALVEDACQAHGARYQGRRVGSFGTFAAFSFYPTKNLGAFGDGGAVVTNDDALADRVRLLRNLGEEAKYRHIVIAGNDRLDTLQASVLSVKLRHLDRWNETRRRLAAAYAEQLAGADLGLPYAQADAEHVWHLYPVLHARRDQLRAALTRDGIGVGMHYPIPVHLQPALAHLGYREGAFRNAERRARQQLSLPMYPELTLRQVDEVTAAIRRFLRRDAAAA